MNNRIRYTLDDVAKNTFYQLPKFLLTGEFQKLNNDTRVLYSVLRDRHDLSLKNKWMNENNEVYIICSRAEMCELLGLSEKTVIKAMNNLKKFNLVEEERVGLGNANRIYLLNVKSTSIPQNSKFYSSETVGFTEQKQENLRFLPLYNNTNGNDNESSQCQENLLESENPKQNSTPMNDIDNDDFNNPNNSEKKTSHFTADQNNKASEPVYDYNKAKELIKQNICYDYYLQNSKSGDMELINELVSCMLDIICSNGDTVKIGDEIKSRAMIIDQYLQINALDIEHILDRYKNQSHKITHLNNYLKKMLYTVKQEHGHYYTNAVRAECNMVERV